MKAYTVTVAQTYVVFADSLDEAIASAKLDYAQGYGDEPLWTYETHDITPEMLIQEMEAERPQAEPQAWVVYWGTDWERTYYGEGDTTRGEILERVSRQLARELSAKG